MGTQRRQFGEILLEKNCVTSVLKDEVKVLRSKVERVMSAEGKEQKCRSTKLDRSEGTNYGLGFLEHKVA